jgi:hypothetical protein
MELQELQGNSYEQDYRLDGLTEDEMNAIMEQVEGCSLKGEIADSDLLYKIYRGNALVDGVSELEGLGALPINVLANDLNRMKGNKATNLQALSRQPKHLYKYMRNDVMNLARSLGVGNAGWINNFIEPAVPKYAAPQTQSKKSGSKQAQPQTQSKPSYVAPKVIQKQNITQSKPATTQSKPTTTAPTTQSKPVTTDKKVTGQKIVSFKGFGDLGDVMAYPRNPKKGKARKFTKKDKPQFLFNKDNKTYFSYQGIEYWIPAKDAKILS